MEQKRCILKISYFRHFLFLLLMAGLLTSCESRRTIVNGLDEKEANEILVFSIKQRNRCQQSSRLSRRGRAEKQSCGISVLNLPRPMKRWPFSTKWAFLAARGQNLLGIFSNVGLVPSGMQEKIRYQAGLAEQIASTIRKIDGVLDADVQISFPDEDPLNPGA